MVVLQLSNSNRKWSHIYHSTLRKRVQMTARFPRYASWASTEMPSFIFEQRGKLVWILPCQIHIEWDESQDPPLFVAGC